MTEHTISECNCGNCDIGRDKCPRYNDTLEQLACINHPKAREVLMRDVIERLEERRGKISARNDETPQYLTQGNVNEAMMQAFDEAISLIRDGVKKE